MHRRRYLALAGAALVAGCQSGGESTPTATETEAETSTATPSATPTAAATSTPTPTPGAALQVRISYPDDWSGDLRVTAGGSTGSRSLSDRGEEVYDVDPEATALSLTAKKEDNTRRTLTAQILRNGEVLDEGTTDEPFGEVELSATFS